MNPDYAAFSRDLRNGLKLDANPIAISFTKEPPPSIPRVAEQAPAGCSYWKMAANGEVFYTAPEDHFGCPVGAFTHNVELPAEKARELESTVGLMVQLKYLRMEEVPNIPHRSESFHYAVYSPLDKSPLAPDVVLLHGTPKQMMLIAEAAQAIGAGGPLASMGRPACCAIPHAMNASTATASFGCIGNRVYTGLDDNQFYFSIPGTQIGELTAKLTELINANEELRKFHSARCNC
jgi:uncharacterized protein (DUF169 family)